MRPESKKTGRLGYIRVLRYTVLGMHSGNVQHDRCAAKIDTVTDIIGKRSIRKDKCYCCQ